MDTHLVATNRAMFLDSSGLMLLQPRQEFRLTPEQESLLWDLEHFEAPYLKEVLLGKKVFDSEEAYATAFLEFKKFLALSCFFDGAMAMTSPEVDAVWHQFILFTRKYIDFCDRFVGRYLHHEPTTSFAPVDETIKGRFFDLYRQVFGDPPAIWSCENKCSSCSACRR